MCGRKGVTKRGRLFLTNQKEGIYCREGKVAEKGYLENQGLHYIYECISLLLVTTLWEMSGFNGGYEGL